MRLTLQTLGLARSLRGRRECRARVLLLLLHRLAVRQARTQAGDLAREFLPPRRAQLLRDAQPLVAEHAGEELRALTRGERLHHGEFFLAREVGVEELRPRHPDTPLQHLRDGGDRVGDRLFAAVEVELRHRESAHHTVLVPGEFEVELHPHRRTRSGTMEAQRLVAAACGVAAVERPRDRFEDRRLARTIGPDDAGEAEVELDLGLGVLPEVEELQSRESHASLPGGSREGSASSASSRYRSPSVTRASRSTPAVTLRACNASRSVSASDGRRPGEPDD